MKLNEKQENMLNGKSGEVMSLAMKTLVNYGDAFQAKRLVEITSAHVAGSFGIFAVKSYYNIINRIVTDGLKVKVPTTVNPRPGNRLHMVNQVVMNKQQFLENSFKKMGIIPNYSCACYDGVNVPSKGEPVAWAESSAVQYANSVLGAKTNRNSVMIDICSAVTGYVPEFGYMLDENRRGQILVKLKIDKMDASALGFIIGQRVVDKVPVIEHYPFTRVALKNMGGAMAASGAVALFHVEGLTPEAPDMKSIFDREPEKILTITQKDIDDLRTKDLSKTTSVVFGCPHMTLEEANDLAGYFNGASVKRPTCFCMTPAAKTEFEKSDRGQKVTAAGVKLYDHCPVAAFTVRRGNRHMLTSSAKCFYYLAGTDYGTKEDCLRACGVKS
ncbi:MAG: aconitase X catalytic domain-containing protein [Proteobacteria bacterium]|nr:aconitase X catalytic domain-containing protein [Pseudomonadota bacterium]